MAWALKCRRRPQDRARGARRAFRLPPRHQRFRRPDSPPPITLRRDNPNHYEYACASSRGALRGMPGEFSCVPRGWYSLTGSAERGICPFTDRAFDGSARSRRGFVTWGLGLLVGQQRFQLQEFCLEFTTRLLL